jgi:hypothetical protein
MVNYDRLNSLMALSPRRFHISANPPFGLGIVICSHMTEDDDSIDQFTFNHEGIANCKPGIWRSFFRTVHAPEGQWSYPYEPTECIVHWVANGTIDLTQSVKDWLAYDMAAREKDATIDLENTVLRGIEWENKGTFSDDGGICAVLSTEYLTKEAAAKLMIGGKEDESEDEDEDVDEREGEGGDEEEEEEEEVKFGYYLETVTLSYGLRENRYFTLGGMSCMFSAFFSIFSMLLYLSLSKRKLSQTCS